ncbi:MAG: ATP-binding protein [Bacteroidetes bacterium]|nr:ATP-binding protein [Bacteroidota bacterium]
MEFKRHLAATLNKWMFRKKILIITGARQVGKTTLLQDLLEKSNKPTLYINAEEPANKQLFAGLSVASLRHMIGNNELIVIDEAQQIENIGLCLKMMADNFKEKQIIATGSSALEIADKIFEPLTGRHFLFHLYPFSLSEIYDMNQQMQLRDNLHWHLVHGLYPDAVLNKEDAEIYVKSLAGSYLYKDVLAWKDIRKPELLDKLLQLLAHQMGNEVSMHELATQLKVKSDTVETYIDLLEKSFVVYRLRSHSTNDRKEVSKMKKIYFWDNGIRNAIIDNFKPLALRNDSGALWENFIVTERIKMNHYKQKNTKSKFWRSMQQQEVDYVETEQDEIRAYEMKWNPLQKTRITKAFTNLYPNASTEMISPDHYVSFVY